METKVLCLPKIPHKLKMYAKKALRKENGTADGWRKLVDILYDETFNEKGELRASEEPTKS